MYNYKNVFNSLFLFKTTSIINFLKPYTITSFFAELFTSFMSTNHKYTSYIFNLILFVLFQLVKNVLSSITHTLC